MKGRQEATDDKVIDAQVVVVHLVHRMGSALVGMIAWWSVTLASLTTRPRGKHIQTEHVLGGLGETGAGSRPAWRSA